jgi:hypothetical protein
MSYVNILNYRQEVIWPYLPSHHKTLIALAVFLILERIC